MNLEKKEEPKSKKSPTKKVVKVIIALSVIVGLFYIQIKVDVDTAKEDEKLEKQMEAEEEKEQKAALLKEIEDKRKEKETQNKREELVSSYLKLPTEKFELEPYSVDDVKGSKYYVVAEGKGYTARFNKDNTKLDKFVEVPMVTGENGESSNGDDSPSYDVYTDHRGMPIIIPRGSSESSSGINSKSSSGSSYKNSSGGSSRSSYRSSTRSSSRR